MAGRANSPLDPNCVSTGRALAVGTVGLRYFTDADGRTASDSATHVLAIDVIALPGFEAQVFHFVTLVLAIEGPDGAVFVDHSGRNTYHREVPSDPAAAWYPDPDATYWEEAETPSPTLRIREDETDLWSGPGNGRTYYVGVAGLPEGPPLEFIAFASASETRVTSCPVIIDDLRPGHALPVPA